jgi:hypothetical protein
LLSAWLCSATVPLLADELKKVRFGRSELLNRHMQDMPKEEKLSLGNRPLAAFDLRDSDTVDIPALELQFGGERGLRERFVLANHPELSGDNIPLSVLCHYWHLTLAAP